MSVLTVRWAFGSFARFRTKFCFHIYVLAAMLALSGLVVRGWVGFQIKGVVKFSSKS